MYNQEYAKAYYLKNKEKILAQTSAWAKANPEKRRAIVRASNKKHRYHKTSAKVRTFKRWQTMMRRCYDVSHRNFNRYGGRGIMVCNRWQVYQTFSDDMGLCPPDMTLDRLDNAKGYEPGNCRWATWAQQSGNRSSNRYVLCHGSLMTVSAAADRLGVKRNGLISWTRRHPEYRRDVNRLKLVQTGKRSFYHIQ